MSSFKIKISLVDDESLVNQLLSKFLGAIDRFKVISISNDGSEFIDYLKDTKTIPDIVLLDLKMKRVNGIETMEFIRNNFPDIKIISLTSHYKDSNLGYMVKTGVAAFLPKEISPDRLVQVIDEVHKKGFYLSSEQIDILRNQLSHNLQAPNITIEEQLSERELVVLKLLCKQLTTGEIAEQMFISKRTVEGHRKNLYLKTGVKNLVGLIIYAAKFKLIDLDECEISPQTNP
ncbi:response regulator transcription factor [Ancylomarina salipaludis]|uniref:Response regulator transcription factor n=1 Tax=Ancylomarina salipaludis TaxID=2501299 RepID=A0A4Q1JMT4_9BACT|nr:response regulator transcription factor [Ancylomarina salipaludis]RXQ95915.1 response regulator transcription factor [Ancylomarina salipaludis]